jgi:hypothetical protein
MIHNLTILQGEMCLTILQDEMWRWIMMHYSGGCGEMDNIVLRSATSPSCKMRCGDGLGCMPVLGVWGDGQHCITIRNQIAKWDLAKWTKLYSQCRKINTLTSFIG